MKLIPLHSERGDELFRVTCICHFASKIRCFKDVKKKNEGNFCNSRRG